MVRGIWKNIDVVCGNHPDNQKIRLVPTQGKDSMFYACPKYRQENREENERACPNRITLKDYEAMVNHISGLIEENGGFINLTNHTWTSKSIEFRVLKHNDDYIRISMLNKKALL